VMWLDLETTGLEVWDGPSHILEVGATIDDKIYHSVINYPYLYGARAKGYINDFVYEMHSKSGLWKECESSSTTIKQAEQELINFIKENNPSGEKVLLAGNTVHFDKTWLQYHCKEVSKLFDYRVLDVSTLKKIYKLYFDIDSPLKKGAHRVLDDIKESKEEFGFYMNLIKNNGK
jgi:oligoribonuclease